ELDIQEERIDRHFDFAVIAAGAWSSALAQDFGVELAVRSVPGQSCHTGSAAIRSIVRYDGLHLLPTAEGAMCGGTVEEESYDAQIRVSSQRRLHRFCQRVLVETPSLTDFRVGLRPKPRRGRPVIGPLQLGSQVFVATGHYKNGVLMGPLTGQVLARWIHNGDPGREMSIFAVER
ncbi:uncharacterized protein METZ01_LOCUS493059, partial [marine metagenome]